MKTPKPVSVVIPTMGRSPCFERCLEALSGDRRSLARITVVADSRTDPETLPVNGIDHLIDAPAEGGFAVSCNLGLADTESPYVAIVNDDAVVEHDWLTTLVETLENDPGIGAVQGINFRLDEPQIVDGSGIAWNRRWQPIQIDHGGGVVSISAPTEIFGASATAALYRTSALQQAAIAPDQVFDPRLHTYYDDVDIASRLRAAGHGARVIPAARAFHAGGASSASLSSWRYRQLTCNRLLVLARLLGRSFWIRLPIVLLPDLKTLGRAIRRRETVAACGIRQGWRRAATLLRFFTHGGPPLVPLAELARFRLSEPPTSKTS